MTQNDLVENVDSGDKGGDTALETLPPSHSTSQAALRRQLGLEPNPALDALVVAPVAPSLVSDPRLAVKLIVSVRRAVPSMACEDCGARVPIEFAIAGLASERQTVLCDDCRLDIALHARESLLTDRQRAIREAYRRIGNNHSAIGRAVGVSRWIVARELKAIDHILNGTRS